MHATISLLGAANRGRQWSVGLWGVSTVHCRAPLFCFLFRFSFSAMRSMTCSSILRFSSESAPPPRQCHARVARDWQTGRQLHVACPSVRSHSSETNDHGMAVRTGSPPARPAMPLYSVYMHVRLTWRRRLPATYGASQKE
jgi:hypothetical protein